ncbi:hypothetical protein ACLMJK_007635 [Lecanora helva]
MEEDHEVPDFAEEDQIGIPQDDDSSACGSDDSEMESFAEYGPKIELLLEDIGLTGFSVEPLQHGYSYQNCVYALKSLSGDEGYIMRVPNCPDLDETGSRCQDILDNVSLLGFLADKLPVPQVKAYSASTKNALGAPFEIQTRLPGQSLDHVYSDMSFEEKALLVDQFVKLLVKLESVTFATAGTFAASSSLPDMANDFTNDTCPSINFFNEGDEEFVKDPRCAADRAGPNLRALLTSHLNGWIQQEMKGDEVHRSFIVPPFRRLLGIVESLCKSAPLKDHLSPVVLYHWDLEPRNVMVEKISGVWTITGIIDWDDACAVPRPLARKPPAWIWEFEHEICTGHLDTDFHPVHNLSNEDKNLKSCFDIAASVALPGYLEDAYGRGQWFRRMWQLIRTAINTPWYLELMDQLLKEWDERPTPAAPQPESRKSLWKMSLDWLSSYFQI